MAINTSTPSATSGNQGTVKLAGALGGTADSPTVTGVTGAAITVANLANGTAGQIPTWDASGVAAVVATGSATQVLTSNGAGAAPTFQTPAGGSLSWGATAGGTTSPGIGLTINNNASNGTVGLSILRTNTQSTQNMRGIQIDMGTATTFNQVNYGVYIYARSVNDTTVGILVDAHTTTTNGVVGLHLVGRNVSESIALPGGCDSGVGLWTEFQTNNTACMACGLFQNTGSYVILGCTGGWNSTGGVLVSRDEGRIGDAGNPSQTRQLALATIINYENYARTAPVNSLSISRMFGAGTITDNYKVLSVTRTTESGSNSSVITSNGSVAYFENIATITHGSLTDNVIVLNVVQDADSLGVPISVTQNAVVSTNFKKIASFAGVTLWVSDGTDPNGVLAGTAGDVCFNGASSKVEYCTGTTVWV